MKHVLAPISTKELPDGWEANFPFYALSVKPFGAAAALALLPKDKELHLWEWADFTNKEEARAWGKKMAGYCAKYKAKRFYINCEAEWAGMHGYPWTSEPYQNLVEAVASFILHAPEDTELVYNGFSWSRTDDGRKLHDKDLIKLFDAWCPMIYQKTRRELDETIKKLDKYKIPGQKRIPMFYAGRYEHGVFNGQKVQDLADLVAQSKPDEVAWYFGNGSKSRYFELVAELPMIDGEIPPSHIETTYTVVRGDSWWGIANKAYNNGSLWFKLKDANGGKPLHPGDKVVLPKDLA